MVGVTGSNPVRPTRPPVFFRGLFASRGFGLGAAKLEGGPGSAGGGWGGLSPRGRAGWTAAVFCRNRGFPGVIYETRTADNPYMI